MVLLFIILQSDSITSYKLLVLLCLVIHPSHLSYSITFTTNRRWTWRFHTHTFGSLSNHCGSGPQSGSDGSLTSNHLTVMLSNHCGSGPQSGCDGSLTSNHLTVCRLCAGCGTLGHSEPHVTQSGLPNVHSLPIRGARTYAFGRDSTVGLRWRD